LTDVYKSNQDINLNLITVNSKLGSRERIQKLAYEELGMFYPIDNANVHNIKINSRKESFCLIDYIVPSAEALIK
jgi:cell division protein FtsL